MLHPIKSFVHVGKDNPTDAALIKHELHAVDNQSKCIFAGAIASVGKLLCWKSMGIRGKVNVLNLLSADNFSRSFDMIGRREIGR